MVYWLQTLLNWCDNNTTFIGDVSRVYANSLPQKIGKKQNQTVHTHTAFVKHFFKNSMQFNVLALFSDTDLPFG